MTRNLVQSFDHSHYLYHVIIIRMTKTIIVEVWWMYDTVWIWGYLYYKGSYADIISCQWSVWMS